MATLEQFVQAQQPSHRTAFNSSRGQRIERPANCTRACPVAIEIFDGNTADPMTLATQVAKLKQRFHLDHVVLVGDRGMITQARITEDIKSAGLDWITALRAPAIRTLLESGTLQLSLFDQRDMPALAKARGQHHRAGLSRRAPGGLPQPRSRRRASPQGFWCKSVTSICVCLMRRTTSPHYGTA
jgi:hypothetical protein